MFDPLGLSKDAEIEQIKLWREAEIKHGRVAMLATVGVLVAEVGDVKTRFNAMLFRAVALFSLVMIATANFFKIVRRLSKTKLNRHQRRAVFFVW